uniref:Uncharacterized protein n=1 Tax=Globodera rostochiensis TaxID=31243 RepID=A0A914HK80_GLORO
MMASLGWVHERKKERKKERKRGHDDEKHSLPPAQHNDGDALRAWGALPTNCSPSSRSSSGVSTADSASLDGGGGARRMTNGGIVDDAGCKPAPPAALVKEGRGRKRLAGNGPNDGVPPLRKRRRVGPRIGPRRKRRAQPAKGQGKGRQTEAAAQVLLEHGGVSPSSLKMALIRVPEQAQQLIADRSKRSIYRRMLQLLGHCGIKTPKRMDDECGA